MTIYSKIDLAFEEILILVNTYLLAIGISRNGLRIRGTATIITTRAQAALYTKCQEHKGEQGDRNSPRAGARFSRAGASPAPTIYDWQRFIVSSHGFPRNHTSQEHILPLSFITTQISSSYYLLSYLQSAR